MMIYIGTHVDLGLVYSYNGDDYDDSFQGNQNFEDSIPSIGMLFLKGVKFEDNGIDDANGVSN
jgi:hypothetical protein